MNKYIPSTRPSWDKIQSFLIYFLSTCLVVFFFASVYCFMIRELMKLMGGK